MPDDPGKPKKPKNKFKREKSHLFTIVDAAKKEVGSVRITPNAIGWKAPHTTEWIELTLKEFEDAVMKKGTKGEAA